MSSGEFWKTYWDKPSVADGLEKFWREVPDLLPLNSLLPKGCSIVLDAGCGTGRWRKHVPEETFYVGADFSKTMLSVAKKKHLPNSDFVRCDIEHLPFAKPFDAVVCIAVIRHLPEDKGKRVVKNLLQIAKTLILTAWIKTEEVAKLEKPEDHGYQFEDLIQCFGNRKFETVSAPRCVLKTRVAFKVV